MAVQVSGSLTVTNRFETMLLTPSKGITVKGLRDFKLCIGGITGQIQWEKSCVKSH